MPRARPVAFLATMLAVVASLESSEASACSLALPPGAEIVGGVTLAKDAGILLSSRRTQESPLELAARIKLEVKAAGSPLDGSLVLVEETGSSVADSKIFVWRPASGALPVGELTVSYDAAAQNEAAQPTTVKLTIEDKLLADPPPPPPPSLRTMLVERGDSALACKNDVLGPGCGISPSVPSLVRYGVLRILDVDPPGAAGKAVRTSVVPYFRTTTAIELRDRSGAVLQTLADYGQFTHLAGAEDQVCVRESHVLRTDPTRTVSHPPVCASTASLSFAVTDADLDSHATAIAGWCSGLSRDAISAGVQSANGRATPGAGSPDGGATATASEPAAGQPGTDGCAVTRSAGGGPSGSAAGLALALLAAGGVARRRRTTGGSTVGKPTD